ncbi:MAG: YbjN domain-containing protein [Parvularculaceae bacterium]
MRKTIAGALVALLAATGPAAAQNACIGGGLKVGDLTRATNQAGAGTLEFVRTVNDQIFAAGTTAEDINYGAVFVDCDNAASPDRATCGSVSLISFFGFARGAPVDLVNAWNNDQFLQAYIDEDGDPTLQHYLIAPCGASTGDLAANMDFWRRSVLQFAVLMSSEGRTSVRNQVSASGDDARAFNAAGRAIRTSGKPAFKNVFEDAAATPRY